MWVSYHWLKIHPKSKASSLTTKVSVLIPFKNEASNIPELLNCLSAQTYPESLVELIFIDDHSDDESTAFITSQTLVVNEGKGKKAALITGLRYASGDLIVTIDADCIYGVNWLETLVNAYETSKADLLIAPVTVATVNTLWEKIQALEFQSLVASAAAAALGRHPIMCNGANLAFQKKLYNAEDDVFNQAYDSGDDMFLMEYAKRKNANIIYVKSREAMASTKAVSWSQFWRQRFRWTSKSSGYRDVEVMLAGGLVFLTNLSLLALLFVSLKMALTALLLKLVADFFFLFISAVFFGQEKNIWLTILLTPIYPVYVLLASIGGLFYVRWK